MKLKTHKSTLKPHRSRLSSRPSHVYQARMRGRALQERNARMFRQNPCCVECEKEGIATPVEEWDHEIPIWVGGPDTEANIRGLCIPHHRVKTEADKVKYGLLIPR